MPVLDNSFDFDEQDFEFDYFCGTGPGGQHRNKTMSNVKVTHIPTGITATAGSKSQYNNKKVALSVVKARISESNVIRANKKQNKKRTEQIGDMSRGKRVRTYDFIKGVIRDERVKKTFRVKEVLGGRLDLVYNAERK